MPLGDALVGAIGSFIGDVLLYGTARVIVPLFTFGRVRVETGSDDGVVRFGWLGFGRDSDSHLVLSAYAAGFFGLVFWVAVIAGVYLALS
jgi:tetrahydromethanopterin S-methyltransferase subunit E